MNIVNSAVQSAGMVSSPVNPSLLNNITTATNASCSFSTHPTQASGEGNCLRVCHFNANSLRTRIETLRLFLSRNPLYHIIAISETKLGPIVDDTIVMLDGYNLLRQDRKTNGGGVALFVHNSLSVNRLCSSEGKWSGKPGVPEYLFCEVSSSSLTPVFVGVVYRPPHAPFLTESNFIPDLVDHMHNYSTKIITSDFNADQLSESVDANFLRNLTHENSLTSIPFGATYHTSTSDSALDLCFVDSNDLVIEHWKTDVPFADGHDLISASIKSSIILPHLVISHFVTSSPLILSQL